jgi:hypothetical protein
MENQIKKLEKKALSNDDLEKMTNHKCNIYVYDDLFNFKTLDDVLGKNGCFILLYESKENYGHWTCMIKINNKLVEMFDSYGIKPDREFNYMPKDFKKIPYLSKLMKESPYELSYNHHRFQQLKKDINTCGRWCALRVNFKFLPLEEFKKLVTNDKFTPDETVTLMSLAFE